MVAEAPEGTQGDDAAEALTEDELAALVATAQLFGDLLLDGVDAVALRRLQEPGLAEGLAALGVEVPMADPGTPTGAFALDALRRAHEAWNGPPRVLVASTWSGAHATPAAELVDLAALAGFELTGREDGPTPVDHLGSVLHLWAACAASAPAVADVVASDHLAFADAALAALGEGAGFHPSLARATRELVATITRARLTA